MTVMVREDLNAADLAWAAADPSMAHLAKEMLQPRQTLSAETLVARAPASPGPRLAPSAPPGDLR